MIGSDGRFSGEDEEDQPRPRKWTEQVQGTGWLTTRRMLGGMDTYAITHHVVDKWNCKRRR